MSWLLEKLRRHKDIQVETGGREVEERKGLVTRRTWDKLVPHPPNLAEYEKYYKTDADVNAGINRLVSRTVGRGYYTECENERAKEIVDNFAEDVGLDQILKKVVAGALTYGFCPVERYLVKGPPKGVLRLKILPSRTVQIKRDPKGKVLGYKQTLNGHSVDFKVKEIVWFVHNPIGVNPYGTSSVACVLPLLKAREQTHKDMPKIIHRYSSPLTEWETAGDIKALKDAVISREPNEDIFLGHVGKDDVRFKTVEIDPRGRFTDYIKILDDAIIEGLDAPIMRSLRNSTEASAKVQLEVSEGQIQGIQRYVRRVVEREIFAPLLASYGISDVPSINWGAKKTGLEDLDLKAIASLVEVGAITPLAAQDLMRKMGLPLEEKEEPETPEPQTLSASQLRKRFLSK